MQRHSLQGHHGQAGGARVGIDALQQRHDAPLAMLDMRMLLVQESLPWRILPAAASTEQGRNPMRRGSGRSEEHTSELQSLMRISYAVFCLKKKNKTNTTPN